MLEKYIQQASPVFTTQRTSKINRALHIGREADLPAGEQHVWHHDAGRYDHLYGRERQPGHALYLLVENYQRRVEHRAAEAHQQARWR